MISLRLLGAAEVIDDGPAGTPRRNLQRHRLALLAVLARAPRLTLARDRILLLLWPDAPTGRARHLLRQSLHVLRRDLHPEIVVAAGDDLRLNTGVVTVDVVEFERAVSNGSWDDAAAVHTGVFLDGLHLPDSPEFEEWLHAERSRLDEALARVLTHLAEAAEEAGDHGSAAGWWRRVVMLRPGAGHATLRLMDALERAGDRPGALRAARQHETVLRAGFGAEPDAAVLARAEAMSSQVGPPPAATGTPALTAPAATPRPRRFAHRLMAFGLLAALLLTGVLALSVGQWRPVRTVATRVLVVPFDNHTGEPRYDAVAMLFADYITQTLAQSGLVQVADPLTGYLAARPTVRTHGSGSDSGPYPQAAAAAAAATLVVTGAIGADAAGAIVVHARVHDVASGTLLSVVGPMSAGGDVMTAVMDVRSRVLGALATIVDDRIAVLRTAAGTPPQYEAYHEYMLGLDPFVRHDYAAAIPHFARAAELDTTFLLPVFWSIFAHRNTDNHRTADALIEQLQLRRERLAPVERHGVDYFEALRRNDAMLALASVRRAAALSPGSHWSYLHGLTAFAADRPREAVAAFAALQPGHGWLGDWVGYWTVLTAALHRAGEHSRELAAARTARAHQPDNRLLAALELRALAALGRVGDVQAAAPMLFDVSPERTALGPVSLAMELRAHGHPGAADSLLARYVGEQQRRLDSHRGRGGSDAFNLAVGLYRLGRVEEARAHFDEIARSTPGWLMNEGWRGVAAARMNDRGAALAARSLLLAADDPRGAARLFLARIASLLGEVDEAAAVVRASLQTGAVIGAPFPLVWHHDPDLALLRDTVRLPLLQAPRY
jgi:DNA-binding SARP family transcriptional activator